MFVLFSKLYCLPVSSQFYGFGTKKMIIQSVGYRSVRVFSAYLRSMFQTILLYLLLFTILFISLLPYFIIIVQVFDYFCIKSSGKHFIKRN